MASGASSASLAGRLERLEAEEAQIPLYCLLCTEKRNFSDVSHLLTHISSKSHLSRKFETDLRAGTGDMAAARKMEQFNKWYEDHDIERHLSKRLVSKQHRQRQSKSRDRGGSALPRTRGSLPYRGPRAKSDFDRNSQDTTASPALLPGSFNNRRSDSQQWDSVSGVDHRGGYQESSGGFEDLAYQTPTMRRTRSLRNAQGFDGTLVKDERDRSETGDMSLFESTPGVEEEFEEGDDPLPAVKGKGVRYPGMGDFDAATPEQRRTRNQKKPKSVIERMKISSEAVVPMESIWTSEGEFQRERDIYASPSIDGSPAGKKAPSQAVKRKRARKAAASTAGNRGRSGMTTRYSSRASGIPVRSESITSVVTPAGEESDGQDDDSWEMGLPDEPEDSRDVFRDEPRHHFVAERIASPLDDSRFQLGHRTALQQLDNNAMLTSTTAQGMKPLAYPFLHGSHSATAREPPQAAYGANYMLPNQHSDGRSFNPLCMQTRGGPPSYPQYQGVPPNIYNEVDRQQTNSFQPINGRYGFHHLPQPTTNGGQNCIPHAHDGSDFHL